MRKKLLLADDSITIQKVVELTFPTDEFEVVTAGNGRIAVDKALTFLPDIVLCDVIMPQLNGYQVCEALRASSELKDVPILLLNGAFEPYDDAKAKAVGALGNVSKPFDPPALVARVKEILAARTPAAPEPISAAIDEVASLDPLPVIVMPPDDEPEEDLAPIPEPDAEPMLGESAAVTAEDFTYDDSGTRPVSTMEVPADVRELAARSLSMDAPVFAPRDFDVLTAPETIEPPDEPSDLSQTLHDGLDDGLDDSPDDGLDVELPAVETAGDPAPMEIDVPDMEVDEAASVDFEPENAATVGEARGDAEPDATPFAPTAAVMHEIPGEQEFEPHEFELPAHDDLEPAGSIEEAATVAGGADALEPPPSVIVPETEPEPEPGPDPVSLEIPRPTLQASSSLSDSGFADLPDFEEPAPEPAGEVAARAAVAAVGGAGSATSEAVAVPVDMVQQIAQRVISQVSERVIREIAWDVIPGLAEKLIRAEVERIKARAESEHD